MNSFDGLGRASVLIGLILVGLGTIFLLWPKIPWIGKIARRYIL